MSTQHTPRPTMREIIETAMEQLDTYKHPDVDEAKARIHELLVAAKLGGIDCDCLEKLSERSGNLRIETSWSARGCSNSSDYNLPSFIIDADDPVEAATLWGLDRQSAEATERIGAARVALQRAENGLSKIQAERTAFLARAKEGGAA